MFESFAQRLFVFSALWMHLLHFLNCGGAGEHRLKQCSVHLDPTVWCYLLNMVRALSNAAEPVPAYWRQWSSAELFKALLSLLLSSTHSLFVYVVGCNSLAGLQKRFSSTLASAAGQQVDLLPGWWLGSLGLKWDQSIDGFCWLSFPVCLGAFAVLLRTVCCWTARGRSASMQDGGPCCEPVAAHQPTCHWSW